MSLVRIALLFVVGVALVGGCGGDSIITAGSEGGPCYPNGTCDEGLVCLSDLCVDPGTADAGAPDGVAQLDATPSLDATAPADGAATQDGAVGDGGAEDGGTSDAGPDGGLPCTTGWCDLTCAEAAQANSHFGCDFWPTPIVHSLLDPVFDNNFGVLVHNPNTIAALATITRGGTQVAQATVAAGQSHSFELPIDTGLKEAATLEQSLSVLDAAYHLTTTIPVTAYQANPLDFLVNQQCVNNTNNPCYSYSNDAALLLPGHGLGTDHLVMSRQTFGVDSGGLGFTYIPGFFAVVGTTPGTTVSITFSSSTLPGPGLPSYGPGAPVNFTLAAGEVLQFLSGIPTSCTGTQASDDCNGRGGVCSYCDMGWGFDLTGTVIQSSDPVAVFGGHNCSFVPFDYWACDHLEEQLPPTNTWGNTVVVSRTEPQHDVGYPPEPNVVRILSRTSGNVVTFNPPQAVGASIVLDQGQAVEFEAGLDFVVTGTGPIQVAQHLVGQNYYTAQMTYRGDPAMGLVPPIGQFRTYYAFVAPVTFTDNYLNIVSPVGAGSAPVYLDGQPLAAALFGAPVGGTTYGAARIPITAGEHIVTSTQPFAITVYGFAEYASYLYAGGQGLAVINP